MLTIPIKDRDMIVQYLKNAVVPAEVGANLTQIANVLLQLKNVEEVKQPAPAKKK